MLEETIKTPVQTAVKRVDEQEFARLNAKQLMFVEDAVRLIYKTLSNVNTINKEQVEVIHHESLHAHDASALIKSRLS